MRSLARLALSALLASALLPAAVRAECRLGKIAEAPVSLRGGEPTIAARINGREAQFLVDTGAFYSLVTPAAAERLGMRVIRSSEFQIGGVGGQDFAKVAMAKSFSLGNLYANDIEFLLAAENLGDLGLLGQNIMGTADVEFDLANGVIRFFRPVGCGGNVDLAYWANGAANVLPLVPTEGLARPPILAKAQVDGRTIVVQFDTGANTSFLTKEAARNAGLKLSGDFDLSTGIGKRMVKTTLAPVSSFSIGRETIRNTRLRVGDTTLGDADMLIGADFFLSHRIYVSSQQKKVYFTYNGGPVFRLDGAPRAASQAVAPAEGEDDATAEALMRRAQVAAARSDLAGAEALITRALAREPKLTAAHLARARMRLTLGRPASALEDVEAALAIAPNLPAARELRAAMRLNAGDTAAAKADLQAALKARPDDLALMLSVGALYAEHGLRDEGIAVLGGWTAAHPRDSETLTWSLLNARCWLRASLGHELEKALADCNLALSRGGQRPGVLDSRGLVKLRLGRAKEAVGDYDAALRADPDLAFSHYGRGLAEARLGDKAAALADRAAAFKLDPHIVEQAHRLGLDS